MKQEIAINKNKEILQNNWVAWDRFLVLAKFNCFFEANVIGMVLRFYKENLLF